MMNELNLTMIHKTKRDKFFIYYKPTHIDTTTHSK